MEDAVKAQRMLTEIHTELARQHYEGSKEIPIFTAIQIAKVAAELVEQLVKSRAPVSNAGQSYERSLVRLGNVQRLVSGRWFE